LLLIPSGVAEDPRRPRPRRPLDRLRRRRALLNLGNALKSDQSEEAIAAWQDAAAIFRETGDEHYERVALGDLEAARAAYRA